MAFHPLLRLDPDPDSEHYSDPSSEVERLRDTYTSGESIAFVDEWDQGNASAQASPTQAPPPMTDFRLLDLPVELRYHVYSFLIPHNMAITFERRGWLKLSGEPAWAIIGFRKGADVPSKIGGSPFYRNSKGPHYNHITVETQLFRVSKFVSNEALSVLYGSNTYHFTVHGSTIWPNSLRSRFVFGPLGHPDRLALLRNLRRIHIDVIPHVNSHWAVKRQRSRLEYLVEILKEHADDSNQRSLLQNLKVDFQLGAECSGNAGHEPCRRVPRDAEKFMFGIESLASLSGVKDVEITGLPDWYTKCLQLAIQGTGGDVEKIDWPLMQIRRRVNGRSTRWGKRFISTRKWHQPTLDWKGFAERNRIAVSEEYCATWGLK